MRSAAWLHACAPPPEQGIAPSVCMMHWHDMRPALVYCSAFSGTYVYQWAGVLHGLLDGSAPLLRCSLLPLTDVCL